MLTSAYTRARDRLIDIAADYPTRGTPIKKKVKKPKQTIERQKAFRVFITNGENAQNYALAVSSRDWLTVNEDGRCGKSSDDDDDDEKRLNRIDYGSAQALGSKINRVNKYLEESIMVM